MLKGLGRHVNRSNDVPHVEGIDSQTKCFVVLFFYLEPPISIRWMTGVWRRPSMRRPSTNLRKPGTT